MLQGFPDVIVTTQKTYPNQMGHYFTVPLILDEFCINVNATL